MKLLNEFELLPWQNDYIARIEKLSIPDLIYEYGSARVEWSKDISARDNWARDRSEFKVNQCMYLLGCHYGEKIKAMIDEVADNKGA